MAGCTYRSIADHLAPDNLALAGTLCKGFPSKGDGKGRPKQHQADRYYEGTDDLGTNCENILSWMTQRFVQCMGGSRLPAASSCSSRTRPGARTTPSRWPESKLRSTPGGDTRACGPVYNTSGVKAPETHCSSISRVERGEGDTGTVGSPWLPRRGCERFETSLLPRLPARSWLPSL